MTLVLDAGGLSALSRSALVLQGLRRRGEWPPVVPSVVLAEALTGDHRRDHAVNRLLRACVVVPVDEQLAREAGRLRTATGRAGSVSAVDAVVAAPAGSQVNALVLTSDVPDLTALAQHARGPVAVARA